MDHLERHPLTRGHVNFRDQSVNGRLALESSLSGRYATLDMKEASDRISLSLIDILFDGVPRLKDSLLALSTKEIELPSGELLRKKKFAPMGSALCFPIMSIVHFALGIAAMQLNSQESPRRLKKHLYVYGDDLIVATKHAKSLIETFPIYGMKFNVDKSCMTGEFRESCGVDAFRGVDVTPQRVKTYAITFKKPSTIQTALQMFNGFYKRGLWNLAKLWRQTLEERFGWFPCVSPNSACLGWEIPRDSVFLANKSKWRWNTHTQQPAIKARILFTRPFMSMVGGWEQLLRSQLHVKEGESHSIMLRDRGKIRRSWIPLSAV